MNKRNDYNDSVSLVIGADGAEDMAAILRGTEEVMSEEVFAPFDTFASADPCWFNHTVSNIRVWEMQGYPGA